MGHVQKDRYVPEREANRLAQWLHLTALRPPPGIPTDLMHPQLPLHILWLLGGQTLVFARDMVTKGMASNCVPPKGGPKLGSNVQGSGSDGRLWA